MPAVQLQSASASTAARSKSEICHSRNTLGPKQQAHLHQPFGTFLIRGEEQELFIASGMLLQIFVLIFQHSANSLNLADRVCISQLRTFSNITEQNLQSHLQDWRPKGHWQGA